MAVFWRNVVQHSWQIRPVKESLSVNLNRKLTRKSGSRARYLGLLYYSHCRRKDTSSSLYSAGTFASGSRDSDTHELQSVMTLASYASYGYISDFEPRGKLVFGTDDLNRCKVSSGEHRVQYEQEQTGTSRNHAIQKRTGNKEKDISQNQVNFDFRKCKIILQNERCTSFPLASQRISEDIFSSIKPKPVCDISDLFLSQRLHHKWIQVRCYTRPKRPMAMKRKKEKSYYEILGVTPNATQAQVKESYFKLSKVYHPDKNDGSKDAQKQFASINEAYSILGNILLRKRYDRGTLSSRDVHGEVPPDEHTTTEYTGEATYTGTGIPFSEEATRHAKHFDDFFREHYKEALEKEKRNRAEKQQRVDEYMKMQERAKLSPLILALMMVVSVTLAVYSVKSNRSIRRTINNATNSKQ